MAGQDDFLTTIEPRVVAAFTLTFAIGMVAPSDERALMAYLLQVIDLCDRLIERERWSVRPSFPDRWSGLETIDGTKRIALSTQLWSDNEQLGVIFIAIVGGRRPIVNVGPPQSAVPIEWMIWQTPIT